MKPDPNATLYSFYIHRKNGSGRPLEVLFATRRWKVPPKIAHRMVLKVNRVRHGSQFVRLETVWLDKGGVRAILTDDRCIATV